MSNPREEIKYWYHEGMAISIIAEVYGFTSYRIKRFLANEPEFLAQNIPFLSLLADSNPFDDYEPAPF